MKFILGTKQAMTQIFREDGTVVPVTRVQAGPCVVTQVKGSAANGVSAVQIGFGEQKDFRLNKAKRGHLKGLPALRHLRDFRSPEDHGLEVGDSFTVSIFESGEKVQVVGTSKGKGFQGVVKRHGFAGSPKTHGHKDQLRMPGSIGATDAARVFKGTRMAGHMGDARVTIKNLEIVQIDEENNTLFIKGAVPGAKGSILLISTENGKIEPVREEKVEEKPVEETKEEAPKTEEATEVKTEEVATPAPEKKEEDKGQEEAKTEEAPKEEATTEEAK